MFFAYPSIASILGSIIVFLVLDVLAVALRFKARRSLRQGLKSDDWFSLVGLVGVIGITSVLFAGIRRTTLGYPSTEGEDLIHPKFTEDLKYEISSTVLFAATNGFIKLSVLFFYRRIFVVEPGCRDARNLLFCSTMVFVVMWSTVYIFFFIFSCGTRFELLVAASHDNPADYCLNGMKLGCSYAIVDFISDVTILLMPLPFIIRLHLPPYRKAGVIGAFMLGFLASVASLIRLAWMFRGEFPEDYQDNELVITAGLYWVNLEITLGLLACCLPSLRGLLKVDSVINAISSIRDLLSFTSPSSHMSELEPTKSQQFSESGGVNINYRLYIGDVETPVAQTSVYST